LRSTTVYASRIGELRERLGGLPSPLEADGIWRDIWLEEAHHSTAIEGNTLALKQVEALLAEGRAVTPVWDVSPHSQATDRERPGSFREHDIQPFPGGMTAPEWPSVPALVSDWIHATQALAHADESTLAEAIASLHARFEQIHPFLDGNGRTGRLVLNLVLVRLGYPPAIIYKRDRSRYLAALRRADQGDPGPLGEILARAILDNLYKFVVPAIAGPARLVPLPALATSETSANALRVAAIRGRLPQGREGI
jgi:hypothetical protein